MTKVVIIQRVVPSYRLPIFRKIYKELGWPVAYGRNVSGPMRVEEDESFLHGFDFRRRGDRPTRVDVPLREILEKFNPIAVVAEGALGMSSTWELLARRFCGSGPKVYFWSIGYHPERSHDGVRGLLSQAPYFAAYAGSDGCILYGQDGYDLLRSVFPKKPLFVAQNTMDIDELRDFRDSAAPYPRQGWPELVSVGRMIREKNFFLLVKAFLLLRTRLPNARLTIIGDGPERSAVELAAKDQVGRSIVLPGAIYDEAKIARYMISADAFVMGGRIGLAVNHALAYDLPVFAFARTSEGPYHGSEILSLVDEITGRVVSQYSPDAMADAITSFFTRYPEPKPVFRANIRRFVDDNLSTDRMIDGFRALNRHLEQS